MVPNIDVEGSNHGAGELRLHQLGPGGTLGPLPRALSMSTTTNTMAE